MRPRRRFRPTFHGQRLALVLVLGVAFGWGGCLPGDRSSSNDDAPPVVETRPLRIALHGDPSTVDPHLQSEVIAQAVLGNIFEYLVSFDPEMRIEPQLAVNWSNPDSLTWRFDLRSDATFHDGRPVTVDDVVASLERVRNHPRSRQSGNLVAVAEVRAVDDGTVELRTRAPYSILLHKLAFIAIVPADSPEEITEPIGSGPYRMIGRDPSNITLRAVAGHRRAVDAPVEVEYHFVAGRGERLEGLLNGRFDVVDDLDQQVVGQVQSRGGVRVESISSLSVTLLQMDTSAPPFDDLRVRRAIDLAIDRRALVDDIFGGYAVAMGQMVSPNVFGYSPGLDVPDRDLDAARALLADAGYADGLEVDLEYRAGRTVVEPLIRQLAEVGIVAKPLPQPWSELYERLGAGEVNFYLGGWVCTSGDAGDLLDAKIHSRDPEHGYGRANYVDYRNPELDALIEASNQTDSMTQRGGLLRQALEALDRELPYIPLFSHNEVYGVRDRIRWSPRQDGRVYAFEMRFEDLGSSAPVRLR